MKRICLCAITLMLTACGGLLLSPGDPPQKYTLAALSNDAGEFVEFTPPKNANPHQLMVDLPTLYPPIDNVRIALKPHEQTLDYYADAEWADRLSVLIQESLIYSLQNKGNLRAVSRSTEGIQANYALKVEVRKFYINQKNASGIASAQVDYMVHLVKLPERHIVVSRHFTHAQRLQEQTMENIVNSLNIAHLEVLKSLVPWALEHVR